MVLVFWLLFRSWRKMRIRPLVLESQQPVQGEIPDWLEREGYEVVAAKQRLPLWIQVGGTNMKAGCTRITWLWKAKRPTWSSWPKPKGLSGCPARRFVTDFSAMFSPFKLPVSYMLTLFRAP